MSALQLKDDKIAAGTWVGKKPTKLDVIELFISRTMFHDSYRPLFSKIDKYPTMLEWLVGGPDAPSDLDAWGVEKDAYTFKDLKEFMAGCGEGLWVRKRQSKGKKKESDKEEDK